jgi:hypothetical protein
MSAFALVSGALFRAPEQKTSKAGKPYVLATVKVAADNSVDFWTIMGFGETVEAVQSSGGRDFIDEIPF